MPTYVYKFLETDETIEIQQSFHDDTLTEAVHPETGKTMAVKKVFLPVGVTFKGEGFYKTDSRSSAKKSKKVDKSGDASSTNSSDSSASSDTGGSTSGSSNGSTSKGSSTSSGTSSSSD